MSVPWAEALSNGEYVVTKIAHRGTVTYKIYISKERAECKRYSKYEVRWIDFERSPRDLQALANRCIQ